MPVLLEIGCNRLALATIRAQPGGFPGERAVVGATRASWISFRATFFFLLCRPCCLTSLCYYPHDFCLSPSSRHARVRSFFKHKFLPILRRFAIFLLVVWTVVSLVTLLIELVPGDPAVSVLGEQATPEQFEQFRQRHGLDRPPFFFSFPRDIAGERHFQWHGVDNRYTEYWVALLHADMGRSFRTDRPVIDLIKERYIATIELALAALVIAVLIAIPLGVLAGKNRGTWIDNVASVIALLGISLPGFVIGPLLVYIFAVKLNWLPPSGRFDLSYLILPAVTLGAALSAILTRMVRSSVIEELNEDYVRTARAKGLSEAKVVYKHVLKNGLIPVVTILGLQLGILLAGAIITEKIFGWPGLGLLLVEDGIGKRDYRVVQGCVLVISITYIVANMLTDMVYRWLDPRIRVS
jgi:ABC-type dipeptide/oligopeptide/nickel transport system permease component